MLNSFFEKIYCINLSRRADRKAHVLRQIETHNLAVEIVPGIDGQQLDGGVMSRGRIGCLLSHLHVLKAAYGEGLQSFLILEDDVLFAKDLNHKFQAWKTEVPASWDMLYLGWLNNLPMHYTEISANVGRITKVGTAHALGIRGSLVKSLIEMVSECLKPVDFYYMDAQEAGNAYAFRESLATQAGFSSDIAGST